MFWHSDSQQLPHWQRVRGQLLLSYNCLTYSKFMMVQLSDVARCVTMVTTANKTIEELVLLYLNPLNYLSLYQERTRRALRRATSAATSAPKSENTDE